MPPSSQPPQRAAIRDDALALRDEIAKVVVVGTEILDDLLTALLAGGHLLLEGMPGVGKTLLATTLAEAVGGAMQRIQFTPDLTPTDLLGTYVIMETPQGRRTFEFQRGPLFANVVVADHINRGTPKTQSALLEAMEGTTVSMGQERFELPDPFIVVATQNPLEMEGTFPLPEPELDRFFFKLVLPPPGAEQLALILQRTTEGQPLPVRQVVSCQRLVEMRQWVRQMPAPQEVRARATALVTASQPDSPQAPPLVRQFVRWGASARGAQALVLAAKVRAILAGREAATAADVTAAAHAALRHRLMLNFEGQADGITPDRIVDALLEGAAPARAAARKP